MRRFISLGFAVAMLALLIAIPLTALAAPPDSRTVEFGVEHVGSGKNNPAADIFHDHSWKAVDSIHPRTVTIEAGGTVTWNIAPGHQLAIYESGKRPQDVDTTALADLNLPFPPFLIPDFLIDDQDGRIALAPVTFAPDTFEYTFNEPGRYLVICTFLPHFAEAGMYGWVIVK